MASAPSVYNHNRHEYNAPSGGSASFSVTRDSSCKAFVLYHSCGYSPKALSGTPTYGGVSLTKVGEVSLTSGVYAKYVEVWKLEDLSACSGDTVAFTLQGGGQNGIVWGGTIAQSDGYPVEVFDIGSNADDAVQSLTLSGLDSGEFPGLFLFGCAGDTHGQSGMTAIYDKVRPSGATVGDHSLARKTATGASSGTFARAFGTGNIAIYGVTLDPVPPTVNAAPDDIPAVGDMPEWEADNGLRNVDMEPIEAVADGPHYQSWATTEVTGVAIPAVGDMPEQEAEAEPGVTLEPIPAVGSLPRPRVSRGTNERTIVLVGGGIRTPERLDDSLDDGMEMPYVGRSAAGDTPGKPVWRDLNVDVVDAVAAAVADIPLDGLSDVDAPTPNDGDVLAWNDGDGEWQAAAPGAASIDYAEAGDLSTQAFGDAASAGTSDEVPRADHKHAMMANPITAHESASDPHPGYLTPTEGDAAYAALGHSHSTDWGEAGDISTQAFGDAAAAGSLDEVARADHKHGMMADPISDHVSDEDPHPVYMTEEEVLALITPEWYLCSSMTVTTGTLDAGSHTYLHSSGSGLVEVSEATGSPGISITLAFTGVDDITAWQVHGYYVGSASHEVSIQLYNYDTSTWDTVGTMETETTPHVYSGALADGSPYFDITGNAQMRFYHAASGNITHDLFLDYASIGHVHGSVPVLEHGSLSGLDDDDHPQYLKVLEFGAKGDLLVGTGAGAFDNLPSTSAEQGQVLTRDSVEATGMKWATPAAPTLDWGEVGDITTQAFGDSASAGTLDEIARADHKHGMMADPGTGGMGDPVVRVYGTSGSPHTWTKPAGLVALLVECVGGGGGGGGVAATGTGQVCSAGGGGGGGYARKMFLAADLPSTCTATVGAYGAGGTAGANNGTTGSNSTFAGSGITTVQGTGGGGGTGCAAASSWNPKIGGAGGGSSGGDISCIGGDGGMGASWTNAMVTGYGGASGGGFGGTTRQSVNAAGTAGARYGGGGSGAASNASQSARAGGNGADGVIVVTEYY